MAIGVRKDWPLLAQILDKALADMSTEELREIHRRWAGSGDETSKVQKITLSAEEQIWLSGHTVRARVSYWPPLMFKEPEPSGISVDYLKAIAEKTGLQVKFIPDTIGWKKSLEDLEGPKKHFDLLLTMKRTPEREARFVITEDYLFMPWVVISRDDDGSISSFKDLPGKTVAVENGYVMQKKLQDGYPGIKLLTTKNSLAALEAVSTGKADAYIGNLANSKFLMKRHGLYNLKIVGGTPFGKHDQAMGIRKDWPELASIINKGLKAIPEEQRIAIEQKWIPPIGATAKQAVSLTPEEQKWLSEHPVIRIGIGESWAPFVYVNSDGSLDGYDVDIMGMVNQMTGANIRLVAGPWKDIVGKATKREIDGLAESAVVESRREHFLFTQPYNSVEYAAATIPKKPPVFKMPPI